MRCKIQRFSSSGSRPFKCVFCNWRAKKRSALARHLHLHTEMAAGARIATRATIGGNENAMATAAVSSAVRAAAPVAAPLVAALAAHRAPSTASLLAGGGGNIGATSAARPLFAAAAPPLLPSLLPPTNGDALGLLSALYSSGGAIEQANVACNTAALPSLLASTTAAVPSLPDVSGAFQEVR